VITVVTDETQMHDIVEMVLSKLEMEKNVTMILSLRLMVMDVVLSVNTRIPTVHLSRVGLLSILVRVPT